MTTFALGFLLAWVLAIIKEHGDRKKVVKALVFIPGERPDYPKWLAVNKSWWELIKGRIKPIIIFAFGVGVMWATYKVTGT